MPAFNKRHYETIAKVLNGTKPGVTWDETDGCGSGYDAGADAQWERTCLAFLNHFRADNPQFDTVRFLAACKGE